MVYIWSRKTGEEDRLLRVDRGVVKVRRAGRGGAMIGAFPRMRVGLLKSIICISFDNKFKL